MVHPHLNTGVVPLDSWPPVPIEESLESHHQHSNFSRLRFLSVYCPFYQYFALGRGRDLDSALGLERTIESFYRIDRIDTFIGNGT